MTEKQIERVRKKIKIYRAQLSYEKKRFGGYFDNRGIRYIIPEFYLQIGDYKGALVYFRWFAKAFYDDIGFPAFNLFWALTLFQNNKIQNALQKVYETAFSNTYLLDLICDRNPVQLNKSELMGFENLNYAKEIQVGCKKMLTNEFATWICQISETNEFQNNMNKFISLQKLISDDSMGIGRENLIKESTKLEKQLTGR